MYLWNCDCVWGVGVEMWWHNCKVVWVVGSWTSKESWNHSFGLEKFGGLINFGWLVIWDVEHEKPIWGILELKQNVRRNPKVYQFARPIHYLRFT
jgi:hypothetical protein